MMDDQVLIEDIRRMTNTQEINIIKLKKPRAFHILSVKELPWQIFQYKRNLSISLSPM